ncbi:FAD-dependent monooxygenase [Candidatus Mycobacterium wuenschmannii]|uniref:FAD-dependent monooxygenase n=1 Tax=Candidatus Mycobacterium wuenschmannii TaxID=3027808 RepID=A0ABY8VV92_9MYCO|nr:FAD-dependent monooxygenase [Candidatus Mycobacterium wuenschmannii]WIM87523.1 FAD-dependent monooxygenase [Candidatus Mycobacterium wuenschmannii]
MPFDVLISGGGIAGPSLAYWLTRHGHTVTIVEQAAELRTGGQAVDFRGPAITVLEKMGLLAQVQAGATSMGPLILVDSRGNEVAQLPSEVVSGEIEMHWGTFARILYETVHHDVDYRFGVRVTAADDDAQRVKVTFSDGSSGSYDIVVGADGLHSGLRRLAFGPEQDYVTQLGQCFGFFDIENRLRQDHCGMAYIDSGRTAALQAIHADKPARASLFLNDPRIDFDYRDTEGNKRLFAERFAGMGWQVPHVLADLAKAPVVYFDSIAQVHMDSYARGRVCLTGDAAWCASPRSGMGTTLALVGSYVLAHELGSAEGDYAAAFDRYQRLMMPYVERCQKVALQALKADRYSSGWRATLRNTALQLLRIPAVGRFVARQSLATARSFTLPDY